MSRYAHVTEFERALTGIDLEVYRDLGWGEDPEQQQRFLERFLAESEAWVDEFTKRDFTPLARHTEMRSGKGTTTLNLNKYPVFDISSIEIRHDPLVSVMTLTSSNLRIDRALGGVALTPTFSMAGSVLSGVLHSYSATFASGINNILANYRTGYCCVGNNIGNAALMDDVYPNVASVTTDGSYAYFDMPIPYGLYGYEKTVDQRASNAVLKNGADDSSNWTMITRARLRCAIGNYTSSAKYLFVFVPSGVTEATIARAHAIFLTELGATHGKFGSGGAKKLQAQGFTEEYGEMQYKGQIETLTANAERMLLPFRQVVAVC